MTESNKTCPSLAVESQQAENVQPMTTVMAFTTPLTPSYYRPFIIGPGTPTPHTPNHYHLR
jgi:hypothetical protein